MSDALDKLREYVQANAVRGACCCGRCIDALAQPEDHQPVDEHTVDLTFFKVAAAENANAETFRELVAKAFPSYFDGAEHNYISVGGDVGDQGLALMLIGLGHVLGIWKALSPETMMPTLPSDMKQQLAERGMVALRV